MVYRYKVTLAGLKGFFRIYLVDGENSLYRLHKQLQSDLEFPTDQPILFKALDTNGDVLARYALIDLGCGTVDKVKIKDTVKSGVQSFVYFYDIQSKKNVIITLEGEEKDAKVSSPKLIESKGPIPIEFERGYVAFEDLPEERRKISIPHFDGDDDDDDLDDEEGDEDDDDDDEKEEEEVIYDENE